MRQPMWLSYGHRFTDYLATGNPPEAFFANL
jgi:hypothetical protein